MRDNHHYLMKTFQQFNEDIAQRRAELKQRSADNMKSFYSKAAAHKKSADEVRQRKQEREELKREIKRELSSEAYDPEVQGRSQIKRGGAGEKIGAERKKTPAEMRRKKAIGGGKFATVEPYKQRKDVGQQRQASTRTQQPTQERGSAAAAQKAAALEARKKAARERAAAKKGGTTTTTAAKPKAKEVEKQASKLLSKKKETTVSPKYTPQKHSGYSRAEKQRLKRSGDRLIRDIRQGKEKPASHYDPNK